LSVFRPGRLKKKTKVLCPQLRNEVLEGMALSGPDGKTGPCRSSYAAILQLEKPAFRISTHLAAASAEMHPSDAATTI
jgi:hypothetical protein